MRSLANTENPQRISGLVDDICEALMEYQVYLLNCSFSTLSDVWLDFIATGSLQ